MSGKYLYAAARHASSLSTKVLENDETPVESEKKFCEVAAQASQSTRAIKMFDLRTLVGLCVVGSAVSFSVPSTLPRSISGRSAASRSAGICMAVKKKDSYDITGERISLFFRMDFH